MSFSDGKWHRYVLAYGIEVPREEVEEELYLIRADMKHRMMYEQMSGGAPHPFPEMELEEQADALLEAAVFEVKEPLVLKMVDMDTFGVMPEAASHAKTHAQLLPFLCEAYMDWLDDVRDSDYPEDKHGYHMDPEELEKFNAMMDAFEG